MKLIDLTGRPFGRLTAETYLGRQRWLCKCSCGNHHQVDGQHLRSGDIVSCGCHMSDGRRAYLDRLATAAIIYEASRFLSHVVLIPGSCWLWAGATTSDGYGLSKGPAPEHHRVLAHRRSYGLFVEPIPPGLCVLHECDEPLCVKPDHLFTGTNADNTRDCIAKGRSAAQRYRRLKALLLPSP